MSRIGKRPVEMPGGVSAQISGQTIEVKGPKGVRSFTATDDVDIVIDGDAVSVKPRGSSKRARQQWGMTRTQIQNLVTGVTEGFRKDLEIRGVGYRAQAQGKQLNLSLGLSHPVNYQVPEGIEIETPAATEIVVRGCDKQKVGQVCAEIRAYRPPEPYKGKGVKYADEQIVRKEAKKK